jgi:hypothetical protein
MTVTSLLITWLFVMFGLQVCLCIADWAPSFVLMIEDDYRISLSPFSHLHFESQQLFGPFLFLWPTDIQTLLILIIIFGFCFYFIKRFFRPNAHPNYTPPFFPNSQPPHQDTISMNSLYELESTVMHILDVADNTFPGAEMLGFGEVSVVLGVDDRTVGKRFAAKRLAAAFSESERDEYIGHVRHYINQLENHSLKCLPSTFHSLPRDKKSSVVYIVQPRLNSKLIISNYFRDCDLPKAIRLFDQMCETIIRICSPTLGIDGQASNWCLVDEKTEELHYLDISTPFMRSSNGQQIGSLEPFLCTLPIGTQTIVKRFLVDQILRAYHDPRHVIKDLIANLKKEKLERLIPSFIERSNLFHFPKISSDVIPLTQNEVDDYYADDARTYAFLQALRRIERYLCVHILGVKYPYLIPPPLDR